MFTLTPASAEFPTRLHITGDLTIYEVREAREALLALLPTQPCPWQLDLSGLGELDSAGIQLLLSLQKTLSAGGYSADVIALAPGARALLELLRIPSLYPAVAEELA
jgi:ABC-type transporter Mla MlaB component